MSLNLYYRKKFLENAKKDLQGVSLDKLFYLVEKAVKTNNPDILDYENIISIGAENKGQRLHQNDLRTLLTKVYKTWWYNWLVPKCQSNNILDDKWYQTERCKNILMDNDCNPNLKNVEDDIFEVLNYVDAGLQQFAWQFQENHFLILDVNSMFADKKFLQVFDARLYLNIKLKNLPMLAEKLVDNAIADNAPLLFKFALSDNRNDNVVIYTNYEDIQKIVEVIEKTKKENPEFFEGCKVKNPLMATYKGYMGFGEEPLKYGSYNSIRVDILKQMYDELSKRYEENKHCLTKRNMKKCFENACKYYKIDSKDFYKNKDEILENELNFDKK